MSFDLSTAVPVLTRTPHTLRALLAGLPDAWTESTEGPGSWSPRTIVAHLLHADHTNWIPRARVILDHGRSRALPIFDRGTDGEASADRPMPELLAAFERARAENLATLASWRLDATALAREGDHPELGPVTLRQLLSTWVAHDLSHLAQIARVMAKQYREAVGPWRVHLPIMER